MEILRMPKAMEKRGITGWPKIMLVNKNEEPPVGIPFIRATRQDYALTFRVLVPLLMQKHPSFDWYAIYEELTGRRFKKQEVLYKTGDDEVGHQHSGTASVNDVERTSLEELASDVCSHVDLNMLLAMKMIPAFFEDVAEAIKVNVTNNYAWTDGYNKKTGMCTGYLTEQPRKKSLVILDISYSIPDGLSAGMMTLIQTITDVTHADLILTAGKSYFYTNDEVRSFDQRQERARIPRGNESDMFNQILAKHDMDYEVVITFGDSDSPWAAGCPDLGTLHTKKWYSFFIGERDTYGVHYTEGCGYGQWVKRFAPNVEIVHNTDWARVFRR